MGILWYLVIMIRPDFPEITENNLRVFYDTSWFQPYRKFYSYISILKYMYL